MLCLRENGVQQSPGNAYNSPSAVQKSGHPHDRALEVGAQLGHAIGIQAGTVSPRKYGEESHGRTGLRTEVWRTEKRS